MNTDKLIQFFNSKLNNITELRKISDYRDPTFTTWWNTIISTCERMGQSYKQKVDRIHFYPGILVGGADNSARYAKAYHRGLDDAESFIKSIIEELETWGMSNDESARVSSNKSSSTIINLTISQQQSQEIIQSINLDDYDDETKSKVNELLDELKKKDKNKVKITNAIKWLADKSVDVLITIILNQALSK